MTINEVEERKIAIECLLERVRDCLQRTTDELSHDEPHKVSVDYVSKQIAIAKEGIEQISATWLEIMADGILEFVTSKARDYSCFRSG